jgi:hypothetical protein
VASGWWLAISTIVQAVDGFCCSFSFLFLPSDFGILASYGGDRRHAASGRRVFYIDPFDIM